MSHQLQIPAVVASYFAEDDAPIFIEQEFRPFRGWTNTHFRKQPSRSWARKLAHEGVTEIAIRCGARRADFGMRELTR